ncbi:DUF1501 domain-containing protein [Nocardioidaceae bacterium]|nr:DUF1501 domain-containing protein [Nocardioidaceae bacterium]
MTSSTPPLGPGDDCCDELAAVEGLSRRRFLQAAAATGIATTAVFGDTVRQTAYGASSGGNVLIVLSLRGGIDGLGMVVPHGDPAYAAARPTIAVPTRSLLAKDAMFGLHPSLAPLQPMWDTGRLAAVHAVGLEMPNRSHFAAMEAVEDADPTSRERRGWVNRMVGLDPTVQPWQAMHLNASIVPTMMSGPVPTVACSNLDGFEISGLDEDSSMPTQRRRSLARAWARDKGPLGRAARTAVRASTRLAAVGDAAYAPAAAYPTSWPGKPLGDALRDTAKLVKADIGVEVVSLDYGSFDHHANYGTTEWGPMQDKLGGMALAVDAFFRDLGPTADRVTLVTISEFGRRVAENGSRGLDHGWGNAMLVMGGGVRGGRYLGEWPGLGQGSLIDGDLQVTTDYRQVLGEVLTRRFPDRSVARVFPGLSYAPLGLMA